MSPPPEDDVSLSSYARMLVAAREHLDPESYRLKLLQHVEFLAQRKTLRNEQTPICRLPVEVLSHIFLILASTPTPVPMSEDSGDRRRQGPLSWIPEVNICRHWRKVALSCPSLWADLNIVYSPLTELMLARSKSAPLLVTYSSSSADPRGLLPRVLAMTGRIRSLRFESIAAPRFGTFFKSWQGHHLSILTSLRLKGCVQFPDTLPSYVFQATSSLRNLDITTCKIDWKSLASSCTDLVSLRIDQHELEMYRKSERVPVQVVLDTLRRLQRLETFDIRDVLEDQPSNTPPPHLPIVHLRLLKSLNVSDRARSVGLLINSISIPKNVPVDITFRDFPRALPPATLNLSLMRGAQASAVDPAISHLAINLHSSVSLRLSTDSGSTPGSELALGRSAYRNFFFDTKGRSNRRNRDPSTASTTTEYLRAIDGEYNLATLKSLRIMIECDSDIPTSMWTDLISTLPRLEKVEVVGNKASRPFIMALDGEDSGSLGVSHDGGMDTGDSVPFPALSTVAFTRVRMSENIGDVGATSRLAQALSRRRRLHSQPVRRVVVENCYGFGGKDIQLLRKSSPGLEVLWDGKGESGVATLDDDDSDVE